MSKFSVVIPSKNIDNLLPCVEAVLSHEHMNPEDVVVIDDGLDLSCDINGVLDGVTILPGEKPFIFSRNVNIGIRHTFTKINTTCSGDPQPSFMYGPPNRDVVILNDDALLQSHNGFALLSSEAFRNPDYGIIGATTNVTGQPLQQCRDIGLRQVPNIAFVCVLIPARTLGLIGLLDERYCLDYGCDDSDYCEAVHRAGLKIGVHDKCFVDHSSLVSSFRGDPKTPKSFQQNMGLLLQKWGKRLSA